MVGSAHPTRYLIFNCAQLLRSNCLHCQPFLNLLIIQSGEENILSQHSCSGGNQISLANLKTMYILKSTRLAAMFSGCLFFLSSINPSFAQSIDRNNPTALTTSILSNRGRENENIVYYYSLTAKPGKITITIDSDPGSDNDAFSTTVRLETLNGENLVYANAVSSPGSPRRTVKSTEFTSETPVILLLTSSGHHRIKIDGEWNELTSVTTVDPTTCKQGYVWREAQPNDRVCVTPAVRTQTRNENNRAADRREPNGGAYGPDTCKQGYVWREATSTDHVCVSPRVRAQAAKDNKRAGERRVP
jgi:hypothetical protein